MPEATIIRRRRRPLVGRRPFLAPLWILAFLALAAAAVVAIALLRYVSASTTTVVVVGSGEDEQRAERLAGLFGDARPPGRIQAIYITAARRMEQIAAPLAMRLGIRPVVVSNDNAGEAAARALNEHRGATVMVVTSTATVPKLVEALSGIKLAPLAPDEYRNIYIVSVPALGSAGLVELHY
jgi:hypothetical protein